MLRIFWISGASRVPGSRVTLETFESWVLIFPARFPKNGPLHNCAPIKIQNRKLSQRQHDRATNSSKLSEKCESATNKLDVMAEILSVDTHCPRSLPLLMSFYQILGTNYMI